MSERVVVAVIVFIKVSPIKLRWKKLPNFCHVWKKEFRTLAFKWRHNQLPRSIHFVIYFVPQFVYAVNSYVVFFWQKMEHPILYWSTRNTVSLTCRPTCSRVFHQTTADHISLCRMRVQHAPAACIREVKLWFLPRGKMLYHRLPASPSRRRASVWLLMQRSLQNVLQTSSVLCCGLETRDSAAH